MRVDYFEKTELDIEFYNEHIKDRIPKKIIDMHLHISKKEFKTNVIRDSSDWAGQCSSDMEIETYYEYAKEFYPDSELFINALPAVSKGIDVDGNNKYISDIKAEGKALFAHMLPDPNWSAEHTEKILLEGNFDGYKPYPDFVSGIKGVEIGLFDFLTHDQWAILNKHKKSMVLHLPRAGRFPDDNNIKELLIVKEKYPDIKLIIAHCGRSYSMYYIEEAYKKLNSMMNEFYYDLSAVLNPNVLEFMFNHVSHDRIMYGTDLPVFLWHGKRRWTYTEYFNLVREEFKFNKHEEGIEAESKYTLFLYEQLKNILDVVYKFGDIELANKIFYNNALDMEAK